MHVDAVFLVSKGSEHLPVHFVMLDHGEIEKTLVGGILRHKTNGLLNLYGKGPNLITDAHKTIYTISRVKTFTLL